MLPKHVDLTFAFTGEGFPGYLLKTLGIYFQEMDPEYEAAMLDALRSSKSSDKWDAKEWDKMSRFAGGLEPDDFDRMPGASLLKKYILIWAFLTKAIYLWIREDRRVGDK